MAIKKYLSSPPSRTRTRYALVKATDGTMVLLSQIESFQFNEQDEESKTFSKLANDITGVFRTRSGAMHTISIKDNADKASNIESVKNDILESWINLGNNNGS